MFRIAVFEVIFKLILRNGRQNISINQIKLFKKLSKTIKIDYNIGLNKTYIIIKLKFVKAN